MTSEQPTSPMPAGPRAGARHPERIGPYRILKVLGKGGMGVVYQAEQTSPVQRRVAVKSLRPAASTTITHGYVGILRGLGRNQEAAALEAKVR
jgi:serine/threonine protein kinase